MKFKMESETSGLMLNIKERLLLTKKETATDNRSQNSWPLRHFPQTQLTLQTHKICPYISLFQTDCANHLIHFEMIAIREA